MSQIKHRNLVVDISNIAWISYYANRKDFTKELLIYKVMENIAYTAAEYDVNGILIACDSPNVWRRDIYGNYKKKREKDENAEEVKEVLIELKDFFNESTDIPAISYPKAESDDIIAVFSQMVKFRDDCLTIIFSNDGDFFQLLDEQIYMHSPIKDKGLIKYDVENKDYDLFEKCIRGDTGDNILSAYPRVRKTALQKAWDDKVEMMNLMGTVPKDKTKTVKEAFNFNKKLIDLTQQPKDIRKGIEIEILNASHSQTRNFSKKDVLRFFGAHDLKNLIKDIDFYSKLFRKRVNF